MVQYRTCILCNEHKRILAKGMCALCYGKIAYEKARERLENEAKNKL